MARLLSMYEHDDRPELSYPGGDVETVDCDIAVVGGGISGLSAAVRATELGARVAIIEKMDLLGGNSRFAGGLLSTNSRFQRETGMPDMTEEYYKRANKVSGYTLDPGIFRRYIKNSGTYFEWIVGKGLDRENTKIVMDSVVMIKDRTEPGPLKNPAYGPGLLGSNIIDVLVKNVNALGIQYYLSTKTEKLLTDEAGAVTGLIANGPDKTIRVNAGVVILSSGGFGGNMELLQKYLPKHFASDNYISHYCMLSSTGDGIKMAEEIGAETGKNISVGMEAFAHMPGSYSIHWTSKNPKGLVVNKNGVRFIPEDDRGDGELSLNCQPDGLSWFIFDEALKPVIYEDWVKKARYGDPIPPIETLSEDLIREDKEGKIRISDTLEDIAEFIGAPAQTLRETLDAYNAMCKEGYDSQLFKDKEYLVPITAPPYYAVRLQTNFDVTMGGVSINNRMEAVKASGDVVPGLYVTGDVASNWMGEEYGPLFSSFAWAANSGYLAAEEAVGKIDIYRGRVSI